MIQQVNSTLYTQSQMHFLAIITQKKLLSTVLNYFTSTTPLYYCQNVNYRDINTIKNINTKINRPEWLFPYNVLIFLATIFN